MRIRHFIAGLAVASTGIAAFLTPAAASAATASEQVGPLSSCASPPDTPDATEENRDRFVDLWSGRVADNSWLQRYANRTSVPDGIRAEGFHGMDGETQVWLLACLLDDLLDTAGEAPGVQKRNAYLTGLNMIIFGKKELAELREQLTDMPPSEEVEPLPVHEDMTAEALDTMTEDLVDEPSLTSADQPESDAEAPTTSRVEATQSDPPALAATSTLGPAPFISLPVVQILLNAVNNLLQLISQIQGQLFTLPGLNILASAFYKICAESPTMPLKCSVSLPVGVPIPADVNGDNFPDVTGWLSPLIGGGAVGAKFMVTRLFPGQGKLPAHVFAVYDPPSVKKRIQFGYDGRADTLANRTAATFKLHNVLAALAGDVRVTADVLSYTPGSSQALTFAVKSLVGGSAGVLPSEEDPMAGAVQMTPVPEQLTVDARLTHTSSKNQDTFKLNSTTPTTINAVIDQSTTTTTPKSTRRFTADIEQLPSAVTVDVIGEGETQSIDYTGNAAIDHVRVTDTATPDVSQAGSFTESIYEVTGVPSHVHIDLKGAQDITYSASATIPEVSFSTRTLTSDVLQQQITAKAHEIPKSVHLTNLTTPDQTAVTYDADSEIQDIELSMYDLSEAGDETNLVAKATGIPTHLEFTQTKSTGVYDVSAPGGVDLIEASLTRNGGALLVAPPGDHVTVLKVGDALGLDFKLSGFESAHFDGSEDTTVALGLSPGGQSFDAIADLDDPNVLAEVHVSELPADLGVTISPAEQLTTYSASSEIPLLTGSFTKRDTGDTLDVAIHDIPTSIALHFDGIASTIGWTAADNTGGIEANAHLTPDTLGGTRSFDAGLTITDIPSQWDATWADGNVLFEAPDGIGSIEALLTNHGVNHTLPGDHLSAFYREASGNLDASLKISELRKAAFTKLDGGDGGGFEAALQMGNHGTFGFAADVVLDAGVLTANGEFSNLPADVTLRSEGGRITYDGDSNPDLTVAVAAGTSADAVNATPAPNNVHGVSVRDGASGADQAVKANLHLTGLPDSLDLNSPAGTYEVGGYHPTDDTLVVDVILTELVPDDLSLQVQQVVPTANPVDFKFGPFLSSTAGDGTHSLSLSYTASEELGSLTAEATYANTDDAKLVISSIPKTITVNAAFGKDQKAVNVDMDSGIDEITASYKKVGAADFAASVKLSDVPKWVHLLLGRASGTDGTTNVTAPDFSFTAFAPGLDIEAAVTAEIADPVDVKAEAQLKVTNLGHTVTGALNGATVNITSEPATEKFSLTASGSVKLNVDLGFSAGPLTNTGSLDVDIDIDRLTLGFENATNLQLDLGITTGLKGDYSTFTFALDTETDITIQDTLRLVIGTPFGDVDINIFDLPSTLIELHNVIDHFRLASNRLENVFSLIVIDVLLGYCSFDIKVRPHAEFSTSGSSFTVGQPPSDGSNPPAWLIAPDPNLLGFSLPDFVMDIVMYFTSPYGHDIDGALDCHSRV